MLVATRRRASRTAPGAAGGPGIGGGDGATSRRRRHGKDPSESAITLTRSHWFIRSCSARHGVHWSVNCKIRGPSALDDRGDRRGSGS